MAWRMTGWITIDEFRRLHWSDCLCVEHDDRYCRSRSLAPFGTKAEAELHASRLERARGYACVARELTAR